MRLPELTRKQLRAGKAVEFTFTQRVRRDATYAIQNEKGNTNGQFRVIQVVPEGEKWKALIRYEGDPVRIPDRFGGGYTDFPGRAQRRGEGHEAELEAVDAESQSEQTKEAHERWDSYMAHERPQVVAERDTKRLLNKMRRLQASALRYGVDITPRLQECVEGLEQDLDRHREAA